MKLLRVDYPKEDLHWFAALPDQEKHSSQLSSSFAAPLNSVSPESSWLLKKRARNWQQMLLPLDSIYKSWKKTGFSKWTMWILREVKLRKPGNMISTAFLSGLRMRLTVLVQRELCWIR